MEATQEERDAWEAQSSGSIPGRYPARLVRALARHGDEELRSVAVTLAALPSLDESGRECLTWASLMLLGRSAPRA